MTSSPSDALWCGLDCSTQSLKLLLVDGGRVIRHEVAVNFDQSLQQHFPDMRAGITRATYGLPKDTEQHVIQQVATHTHTRHIHRTATTAQRCSACLVVNRIAPLRPVD